MSRCRTPEILDLFETFVVRKGGAVHDAHVDGERFYLRSVIAPPQEVRPYDRMQGGVAVRGDDREIEVRTYLFREICSNGAVMPYHSGGTRLIRDTCTVEAILNAFEAAADDRSLDAHLVDVRTAVGRPLDIAMMLVLLRQRSGHQYDSKTLLDIIGRIGREEDPTQFGLMNAVTSLGRDTPEPERRWRLEEEGGAVPAMLLSELPTREFGSALAMPSKPEPVHS